MKLSTIPSSSSTWRVILFGVVLLLVHNNHHFVVPVLGTCNLCPTDDVSLVSLNVIVTIPPSLGLPLETASCKQIFDAGRDGTVPESYCPTLRLEVADQCICLPEGETLAPVVSPPSPAPVIVVITEQPAPGTTPIAVPPPTNVISTPANADAPVQTPSVTTTMSPGASKTGIPTFMNGFMNGMINSSSLTPNSSSIVPWNVSNSSDEPTTSRSDVPSVSVTAYNSIGSSFSSSPVSVKANTMEPVPPSNTTVQLRPTKAPIPVTKTTSAPVRSSRPTIVTKTNSSNAAESVRRKFYATTTFVVVVMTMMIVG